MAPTIKLVGLDPGERNFGVCRLAIREAKPSIEVLGFFDCTIRNLTAGSIVQQSNISGMNRIAPGLQGGAGEFRQEISSIIEGADGVIFERFQPRPGAASRSAETVSAMMGITAMACEDLGIPFVPIQASSWKNAFRSEHLPVDDLYGHGIENHLIDAFCMALYLARAQGHVSDLSAASDLVKKMRRRKR